MALWKSKKDKEHEPSMTRAFIEVASRPVRVLIVEDDRLMRESLSMMFENFNVEISEAVTRDQACEIAKQKGFDMALIDLRLPWPGNGISVMKILSETDPDLPICACSGAITPKDIDESVKAAGVVTFVPKAFLNRAYLVSLFRKFNLATRAGMIVTG